MSCVNGKSKRLFSEDTTVKVSYQQAEERRALGKVSGQQGKE